MKEGASAATTIEGLAPKLSRLAIAGYPKAELPRYQLTHYLEGILSPPERSAR